MSELCPYFRTCGGCQNQHVPYAEQLENKRKRIAYLLQQHYTGDIPIMSDEPYHYRNRMDFIVAQGVIGFRQADERKLVDIGSCPISQQRVNTLLAEVRTFLSQHKIEAFDRKSRSGVLRYAVIRIAQDACISFVLNEDSTKLLQAIETLKLYAQTSSAENIVVAYVQSTSDESTSLESFALKGSEYLTTQFCGKTIQFHSQAFFQNNTKMAEKLVHHVKELIRARNGKNRMLVDAYGGVGTFGVVIADSCKEVLSIESHPLGTEGCQKNIESNQVPNMNAVNEDAANLHKFTIPNDAIILLDPPRSGLSEKALRYLLHSRPQTIIYVSCNPSQFAKELTQLSKFYTVEHAAAFDLFPQTNHCESVAVLERK